MVSRLSHFHFVPGAKASMAPNVFLCVARPITDSDRNMGKASTNEQKMYSRMKAEPPYCPTM